MQTVAQVGLPLANPLQLADAVGSITCKANGNPTKLSKSAKTFYTKQQGLPILGFGGTQSHLQHVTIHAPLAREASYFLKSTPTLELSYGRTLESSDTRDHYQASVGKKSPLKGKFTEMAKIANLEEGTFSGKIPNWPADKVVVSSEARFSVIQENLYLRPQPNKLDRPARTVTSKRADTNST